MRLNGTFFFVVGALTVTFAWVCLVWLIPNTLLSLYRYKLWALRDGLQEDLRLERLPTSEVTVSLLRTLEGSIRRAQEISFLNLATRGFYSPMTTLDLREMVEKRRLLDQLRPEQRESLEEYEQKFFRASMFRIFLGTPSGWLGVVTSPIWIPTFYLRDKRSSRPDPEDTDLVAEYQSMFSYRKAARETQEKFVQRVRQNLEATSEESHASSSAFAA